MNPPPSILFLASSLPPYALTLTLRHPPQSFAHCGSASDFDTLLHQYTPDLILSDFALPGLDMDAVKNILLSQELSIPWIVVPEKADESDIADCIDRGASDCIPSNHLRRLQSAIDRELARRQEIRTRQNNHLEDIRALTARLAHDFNNILAPVTMSVPMLKWDLDDAEFDEIVDTMDQCAKMGSAIIRDLLVFGRGLELQRSEVSPAELLQSAADSFRPNLPSSFQLNLHHPGNLPFFSGDAKRMQEVLERLLENAREAMPDGGKIEIAATLCPGQDTLCFSVADSGEGIPPANQRKIFEPFFSTKRQHKKGAGLGLCLALGIVKSHGGTLTVQSQPQRGSRFLVEIPLRKNRRPPRT